VTQPVRTVPAIRSVGAVTRYIQQIIRENKWFREIGVRGEISNLKRSGTRIYFDLKDEDAILNCVVWSEYAAALPALENGLAVVAVGYIDTYLKGSRYQLVARSVTLEGVGDLHAEYEKLKKKLQAEGAFAAERKRKLPRYPYRIALVSSRDARGAGDFGTIVAKRAPHVEVVFVETPVQGTGAAIEIADAIDRASRLDVDVIVVARGGGSFEDLFPFSTEGVARAILRARHPVVSAVGHEGDVSIADLVADVRAETPSAAAHAVAPDRDDLLRRIGSFLAALAQPMRVLGPRRQQLDRVIAGAEHHLAGGLRRRASRVATLERRLDRFDPSRRLGERGRRLELFRYRLARAAQGRIKDDGERLERAARELGPAVETGHARRVNRLQLLRVQLLGSDPETILQHGYAIVRYDGQVVRDPETVPQGGTIRAQIAHGTLVARVEERHPDGAE
jgi:exodeoxyribonuclease VII large subunit